MANSRTSELAAPPPDSSVDGQRRSSSRFRSRDSMGALRLEKAATDAAYARGYAEGIAEGRDEGLDSARTVLLEMLEEKFGEVSEEWMAKLETSEHPELRRYTLAIAKAESFDAVFG